VFYREIMSSFLKELEKRKKDSSGFTLVELVVSVVVLGILSIITFTVFQTFNTVGTTDQAAFTSVSQAQIFQRNFNRDVREAREIRVTGSALIPGGSDDTSTYGSRVDMEFKDGRTNVCTAYYVNGDDGTLYTTNSTAFIAFSSATAGSWLPVSKVATVNGDSGNPLPYFSLSGTNLQYNFTTRVENIRANSTETIGTDISSGATQNFVSPNPSSTCFGTQ